MTYLKVPLNVETVHTYSIDTNGRVINETTGKVLKGTKVTKSNRYVKIILDKRYFLHRLVAEHFVPNPDPEVFTQVNHKDGNRLNNSADNLEWVTSKQNVKHAYATGLKTNAGENNPISILTEQDIVNIWGLSIKGHKPSAIIRILKLDVCRTAVSRVTNSRGWTHITKEL